MNERAVVLVVEDDEDDFFFTQRELRKFTQARIVHLESGRDAICYLAGEGAYADREKHPLPALMFLDLKIAGGSGHDVLAWAHANMAANPPQIFVLTGSNEPRDRERVSKSGAAAGYIVKPLTREHLAAIFSPDVTTS